MSKALYFLEYQSNQKAYGYGEKKAVWDDKSKPSGTITVEAETYDEACEIALKRLPAARGEVEEWEDKPGYSYGYRPRERVTNTYFHVFRLKDCLDQQHATYIPSEINVDNSNTNVNSSTSMAYSRSSIF